MTAAPMPTGDGADDKPNAGPNPSNGKLRIAVVVQRFGVDIAGGAEFLARMMVHRLKARHEVEVLTSCAADHADWAMNYAPGLDEVDGVPVRRFGQPRRNDLGRAAVPQVHRWRFKLRRLLEPLGVPLVAEPTGDRHHDGLDFLRRQGPHCPGLLQWLVDSRSRYDAVLFFTALYEPTALGLPAWGRRSVLVPLLHEEKPMVLPHFRRVFRAAGAVLYNTEAEQRVAGRLYGTLPGRQAVAGAGVAAPIAYPAVLATLRQRLCLAGDFVLYAGRIDVAKGCGELIEAWRSLNRQREQRHEPAIPLVLAGKATMPLPALPGLLATGFLPESERDALLASARLVVVPSRHESLSLLLLEALAAGVAVVANGRSEVLRDHLQTAGAGKAYFTPRGLVQAMADLLALTPAESERQAEAGRRYVAARYTWPRVMAQVEAALQHAAREPAGDR